MLIKTEHHNYVIYTIKKKKKISLFLIINKCDFSFYLYFFFIPEPS